MASIFWKEGKYIEIFSHNTYWVYILSTTLAILNRLFFGNSNKPSTICFHNIGVPGIESETRNEISNWKRENGILGENSLGTKVIFQISLPDTSLNITT